MNSKQIGALWLLAFVIGCAVCVTMATNGWLGAATFLALTAVHQMVEVRS